MNSRELILSRVRANQPEARPLPELPSFERPTPTLQAFGAALTRMGGMLLEAAVGETASELIHARFPEARVIVSATPEVTGTRALPPPGQAASLEDVDVGVVRAAFGVAETGSVYLSEAEFQVGALGFLPQHLVVLLDPAALVSDLHQAYRQPGFMRAGYAALMTGPSATADIEGVLIRGAQGVRSFTVIVLPAPAGVAGQ